MIAALGLLSEDDIRVTLFLFQRGVTTTLGGFLPGVLGVPVCGVDLPALVDGGVRLLGAPSAPPCSSSPRTWW